MAVTGATGFIGAALVEAAESAGWSVSRLVRSSTNARPDDIAWDPAGGVLDPDAFVGVDVVVHLAGEGVAERRWTAQQKARIRNSRVDGTTLIASTIAGMDGPKPALLSGSAVGWYGETGATAVDESGPGGSGFLCEVCTAWEHAAVPAVDAGARVVWLRTGVVLDPSGGALAKQLPMFKIGLGGVVRPGTQYLPWISLTDAVAAILFLAERDDIAGPVNLVAPGEATNAQFTKALGHATRRPTTFTPMSGPRLLLGRELADSLLLMSQRIEPAVLIGAGFEFADPDVDTALAGMLSSRR